MTRSRDYTEREEVANAISHAIGILLGIVGGYILLTKASISNNGWAFWSVVIYLLGMLSSYITSTWYHACSQENRKAILRKFDHAAIYLHIAGTFVPFLLVVLRDEGAWGWSLFSFIWIAAIVGVYLSFRKLKKHSNLETVCYVLMGCSILVAFKPLIEILSETDRIDALYWLIAGGISYILGALFYSWKKKEYMHTVFHLFVLGGSVCHMIAIYQIL